MTKRMVKLMTIRQEGTNNSDVAMEEPPETDLHSNLNHRAMMPFEFCEDDGPLNTIYKQVLSIEIAQLTGFDNDDDNIQGGHPSTTMSPSITNMATAAFSDGRHQLDKTNSRKRRHVVRRIRIFFYNNYADAMSTAFHDLRQQQSQKKRSVKKKGQVAVPLFLLSLANVPAECILPHSISSSGDDGLCHDPHLQHYVQNPYGNEEFGSLSPYCICIGDKSSIKIGDENGRKQPLYFDCEDVEIRLVKAPATTNRPLADPLADDDILGNDENDFVLDEDAVITATSIRH
jgi:hypothetical protein